MKNIRLYNVLFPVWMLFIFPPVIFIVLGGNFIIDSIVLLLFVKILAIDNMKDVYKKTILKVWAFGFLADIIGAALLLLTQFLAFIPFVNDYLVAVAMNCFSNPFACIYTVLCILISGICIYFFNYKISFKKLDIEIKKKKQLALSIAILTAPYLFMLPTTWLYY